jgi:hypothetical protein
MRADSQLDDGMSSLVGSIHMDSSMFSSKATVMAAAELRWWRSRWRIPRPEHVVVHENNS